MLGKTVEGLTHVVASSHSVPVEGQSLVQPPSSDEERQPDEGEGAGVSSPDMLPCPFADTIAVFEFGGMVLLPFHMTSVSNSSANESSVVCLVSGSPPLLL